MTAATTTSPRALDDGAFGGLLLNRARGEHPTVAWWWGRRRVDDQDVAYCYVCDTAITPWNANPPAWVSVKPAIDAHRLQHLAEMRAEINPSPETA